MPQEPLWQAFRALGLLAMALLLSTRVFPGLRPYRTRVLGIALAFYLVAGVVLFLWR
jgi:hypothetical protein